MSIWCTIPLSDYESHMSNPSVAQLNALSHLFKTQLDKYNPSSVTIWGIAGGNGLEHIDPNITKEVIGIDINEQYLTICHKRFSLNINHLQLIKFDLNDTISYQANPTMFIWAALILEYVDIDKLFSHGIKQLMNNGILSVLIQKDNGIDSVSKTDIESIQQIKSIFNIIDSEDIITAANQHNMNLLSQKEHILVSGKSFYILDFIKNK